eukprot:TRINITY_DN4692_c0_g1_i3.p1 TRINITY_DN4692_c0_g1~~TRINITY_DN4692_c0_g1_i3.p1  ORF type:complete len:1802 (-),score=346.75 TRINITY_DN4692_c0_g1_i3:263-5668(-)
MMQHPYSPQLQHSWTTLPTALRSPTQRDVASAPMSTPMISRTISSPRVQVGSMVGTASPMVLTAGATTRIASGSHSPTLVACLRSARSGNSSMLDDVVIPLVPDAEEHSFSSVLGDVSSESLRVQLAQPRMRQIWSSPASGGAVLAEQHSGSKSTLSAATTTFRAATGVASPPASASVAAAARQNLGRILRSPRMITRPALLTTGPQAASALVGGCLPSASTPATSSRARVPSTAQDDVSAPSTSAATPARSAGVDGQSNSQRVGQQLRQQLEDAQENLGRSRLSAPCLTASEQQAQPQPVTKRQPHVPPLRKPQEAASSISLGSPRPSARAVAGAGPGVTPRGGLSSSCLTSPRTLSPRRLSPPRTRSPQKAPRVLENSPAAAVALFQSAVSPKSRVASLKARTSGAASVPHSASASGLTGKSDDLAAKQVREETFSNSDGRSRTVVDFSLASTARQQRRLSHGSLPTAEKAGSPRADDRKPSIFISGEGMLDRLDVKEFLELIQKEQPENFKEWICAYADRIRGGAGGLTLLPPSPSGIPATPSLAPQADENSDLYDLLNWRFFIFNKERELIEKTKHLVRHVATQEQKTSGSRLKAYLPRVILEAIQEGRVRMANSQEILHSSSMACTYDPVIADFDAAVVFADASGFTALTERLAQQPHGAEEIGECLNGFFGPLIEIVTSFGGDILKFSGDALTILWPVRPTSRRSMRKDTSSEMLAMKASEMMPRMSSAAIGSSGKSHRTRRSSVRTSLGSGSVHDIFDAFEGDETSRQFAAAAAAAAACKCCLEVQAKVEAFGRTPVQGVSLTLHIGVGFGKLRVLQLGGLMNRWEYCAAGVPLEEVAIAEPLATSGETVVSESVQAVLRQAVAGDSIADNFTFDSVSARAGAPPGYSLLKPAEDAHLQDSTLLASASNGLDAIPTWAPNLDTRLFERYVPAAIAKRLSFDGGEPEAEMRQMAVIFLSVRGLNPGGSALDARRTQLLMMLFQRSIYALEGSVNKFLVDDKGMLLLAVFGLPPLNHYTDDPLRAVLAAMRLCDTLREEELEGCAGVASGTCWCGVVGSSSLRREYTVLGDVVNLSARLMANARPWTVLVDKATYSSCQKTLEFDTSKEPIKVKGKAEKVEIYQFTGQLVSHSQRKLEVLESELIKWDAWPAKAQIHDALNAQLQRSDNKGGIVFVEGSPGCGKTEAVETVKSWAASKGFALLFGQNMNSTSTFTVPRLCWQEVFTSLIAEASADPYWQARMGPGGAGRGSTHNTYKLILAMLKAVGGDDDLMQWAPLLSFVLPSVNFGAKGVSALLERDEQRTVGTPRLAKLCSKLLEAFNLSSTTAKGTVVLIHMKRGTSFFQEVNVHDENVARAVGQLAAAADPAPAVGQAVADELSIPRSQGQDRGSRPPLIFCVVSRQDILPDEALRSHAARLNGLVSLTSLDRESTRNYMLHLLQANEGREVLQTHVDHVHDVSGGNPYSVEVLSKQLLQLDLVRAAEERSESEARLVQQLRELPLPDKLKGMALATFERLTYPEQVVLKNAAVLCHQSADSPGGRRHRSWEEAAFTVAEIMGAASGCVGLQTESHVVKMCMRLVKLGIFREVLDPSEVPSPSSCLSEEEEGLSDNSDVTTPCASLLLNGRTEKGRTWTQSSADSGCYGRPAQAAGPSPQRSRANTSDVAPARQATKEFRDSLRPEAPPTVGEEDGGLPLARRKLKKAPTLPTPGSDGTISHHYGVTLEDLRFRFVSRLLEYVALTMVLEVQREKIRSRRSMQSRRSSAMVFKKFPGSLRMSRSSQFLNVNVLKRPSHRG